MSYCATQELVDRFGEREILQLTDRNSTGSIDTLVAERAIDDAAAEIDGYLAARYDLPLAAVPAVLVRLNADMARYYLYDDHAPEQVTQRYKAAVDMLARVSRGDVNLGPAVSGGAPAPSDGAQMQSGGRVWGRDVSKGYL